MLKAFAGLLSHFKNSDDDSLALSSYLPGGVSGLAPGSVTVDDLIRLVAEYRGRPIEVMAMPLPAGLYGARLAGPTKDFIIHESNTPLVHQDHIKAHELAHILAGHEVAVVPSDESLDERLLAGILLRSADADSYAEREAEALATAIQAEIIQMAGLKALTGQISTSEIWSDMVRGLGID